jgi:hypothetical protein
MPAYRTAQGKMVDMSRLASKNEKVRAVGNMNVNARGDIVDSNNQVIKDSTKRVKNNYQKAVGQRQPNAVNKPVNIPKPSVIEDLTSEEKELFDNDEDIKK